MRILCCPVPNKLHPKTAEALARYAPDAEIVEIKLGDKHAYRNILREHWTGEEALLNIEHDIEFGEGMVESVRDCVRGWCTYGYDAFLANEYKVREVTWCLGFAKFSPQVQQLFPWEAIQETIDKCKDGCGGAWWHLDWHMIETLKHGHCFCCTKEPHVHGRVIHHHNYKAEEARYPTNVDKMLVTDNLQAILRERGWQAPERAQIPHG